MSVRAGATAPRWLVALVAVLVAADLSLAGGVVVDRTERRLAPVAAAPGSLVAARATVDDGSGEMEQEVRALLARRSLAVRQHNAQAFLATVDPLAPKEFRQRQLRSVNALRVVPLKSWAYELAPEHVHQLPATRIARYGGAATWCPDVLLRYQINGFDTEPTVDEIYPTFVQRSGQWYLGADDDFAKAGMVTQRGPWDFGPLQVTRSRSSIVFSHPGSGSLARLVANEIDRAVPRVDAVWRRPWAHKAVVILPASQHELEALIGEEGLDQIAAVATAEAAQRSDGTQDVPVGDRVMVNPPNFRRLGPLGRRVVLTHELTHVATRSATGDHMPSWMVEGFADYVGYLGSGVPVRIAASELDDALASGHRLRELPSDEDFAADNKDLALAYEGAWLATRLIADRIGSAGLAGLYADLAKSVGPSTNPDAVVSSALRRALGQGLREFTVAWRGYVRRQLS